MNEALFSPEVEYYLDTAVPNQARIFNYLLGGDANFTSDRSAAQKITQLIPSIATWVRLRRTFAQEAAYTLYQNGFRQFLNLGSGMPTENHLHLTIPDAHIIYSDTNPVAVSYGQSLFAEFVNLDYVYGGFGHIQALLQNPALRRIISRQEKVAISLNMLPVTLNQIEFKKLSQELYQWAPPGSQTFQIVQTRCPETHHEKYETLQTVSKKFGCPLHIHAYEEAITLNQPWQPLQTIPLAQFLGLQEDYLKGVCRETMGTAFYAAFFVKGNN